MTLRRWGASPDDVEPLLRLLRAIVVSNARHRATKKSATWAAGTSRDPHYRETPENPGALRPILEIVERVMSDLERLTNWEFSPPIVLHELDARLKPTRRTVCLSRLDETLRVTFTKTRQELRWVREQLRRDTQRARGRKATLVHPYQSKSARRRDLARMLRTQLLALCSDRQVRPRAARAQADRLASDLIASIPVLNEHPHR